MIFYYYYYRKKQYPEILGLAFETFRLDLIERCLSEAKNEELTKMSKDLDEESKALSQLCISPEVASPSLISHPSNSSIDLLRLTFDMATTDIKHRQFRERVYELLIRLY